MTAPREDGATGRRALRSTGSRAASFTERAAEGITRCTEADLDELESFQAVSYGDRAGRVATRWVEWLYRTNPYRDPDGIGIWICRRDGRIVGQQGEIAFGLHACGEDLRATAAVALMVEPAWRLRGVGPALSETARRATRFTCALSVSDEAYRMYTRKGWSDLGEIFRYTFFSQPSAVISDEGRGVIARQLAAAAAAGAGLAARLRRASTRLVPIESFDDAADEVWEQASSAYSVLARRDARSLTWRFDESPFASAYRRFYLIRRARPIGYVVLRSTLRRDAPAIEILDYLVHPRDVGALFAHCITLARRERVVALELLTRNPAAHRRVLSLGFVPITRLGRRQPLRFMVSVDDEDQLCSCVVDPTRWFVTRADADLEFESGQALAL